MVALLWIQTTNPASNSKITKILLRQLLTRQPLTTLKICMDFKTILWTFPNIPSMVGILMVPRRCKNPPWSNSLGNDHQKCKTSNSNIWAPISLTTMPMDIGTRFPKRKYHQMVTNRSSTYNGKRLWQKRSINCSWCKITKT